MVFRIPRWALTSLTVAAIICAAAAGYQSDHHRLRASQDTLSSQLSGALNTALKAATALQHQSVRQPRISANADTVEFSVTRPLLVTPGVDLRQDELFLDSLCLRPLRTGRAAGLGAVPLRLWTLDRVRLYVDKEKGGLWRSGSGGGPELVAARVETLAVELDRSGDPGAGFLLELTGSLDVGAASPVRRKLYRYLPAAEMSRG